MQMKKTLSILMLLVAFLMPGVLRAQGTLTVCNGTDSNEYVPIYGYYADEEQTSQMIFPSSMLTAMQGYAIEQMVFYVASDGGLDANLGNWDISLGITSASMLNGLDNSTALTQVYSGPMIFDDNTNATMMIVSFSTPFVYNGGNLLVEFDHPVSADYNHYYFYGVNAASASYSWDSSFNFLPKTTFSYASCSRPASLTINNVTTTTAAISWTGNASSYEYEVLSANGGPVVSGTTANNYIFVSGLTTHTQYIVSVRAFCSATDTSAWAVTDFRTAMCDDACPITIVMHDSYGDGWGDCSLSIVDGALSRLSLASPTVTEAMILATGAAVSANLKQLVAKTKFLHNLILLDEVSPTLRAALSPVESGLWGVDDDGEPHDLGIASVFLIGNAGGDLLRYGHTLFASGAVSDRLLKALTPLGQDITLIARDFTKLFITPEVYNNYTRKGNRLMVLQRSKLIAVTLNPTSPQGFLLDSERTCETLSEALNTPVYDVVRIRKMGEKGE